MKPVESMETILETTNHIHFQLDLLKLTTKALELTGPSVMDSSPETHPVVLAIENLQAVAVRANKK